MQAFIKHAPNNVISCAMAYVEDAVVDETTGKLVGGNVCSKGNYDPARTVPDLHSVFRGNLSIFIQGGKVCHAAIGHPHALEWSDKDRNDQALAADLPLAGDLPTVFTLARSLLTRVKTRKHSRRRCSMTRT